jgi:hypothetical protein
VIGVFQSIHVNTNDFGKTAAIFGNCFFSQNISMELFLFKYLSQHIYEGGTLLRKHIKPLSIEERKGDVDY